ncbi:hypothetical protein HPB47_024254 [Ixodes persulcatus]|uniref:Uncharacterized protein n=1 Tax=Ixodes persulcatus TaxID=34615 RepID=A0AC60Q6R9_IXOPE|nr:hypothetical protein HPB47_024254 [Ixodes persulcatus]
MTSEALPLVHGILVVLLLLGRCCHGAEADAAPNSTHNFNLNFGKISASGTNICNHHCLPIVDFDARWNVPNSITFCNSVNGIEE